MRVSLKMIHPELRLAGLVGKWMIRPTRRHFRLMRNLTARRAGKAIPGLNCDEVYIPRADGHSAIRTRIYRPANTPADDLPTLLYIHGGGYFSGSPEVFAPIIKQYIRTRDCIIISPDYIKSLQASYPAAIDDCYTTLLWIRDHARQLGGRDDQIMVGGHSAGGGLTAALSLRARGRGEVNIAFQMPVYPMIDDRMDTDSATDNDAPFWNSKLNALGWELYLGDLKANRQPIPYDAAPARATDYSGLPPTMTLVGDLDPLRDETEEYAKHLKQAGVPVDIRVFDGCFHGFDMIGANTTPGKQALQFTMDCFAAAVDNQFAPQPLTNSDTAQPG